MSDSLVSVCIPCHNGEAYLAEAIDSALRQTHPNVEVIVIDDGSTDRSVEILKSYSGRIRWESCSKGGACRARNRALELCHGEFVQFLDSDDLIETHKIERQLGLLHETGAGAALCHVGLFGDEKGRRPEKKPHPEVSGDAVAYLINFPIQTGAPLHRSEWLRKIGGFRGDLRRAQEFDLHVRLAAAGCTFVMLPEILVWVRMHSGPRISSRRMTKEEQLDLWTGLAEAVAAMNAWTPGRRGLFASHILRSSSDLFRAGEAKIAEKGFQLARNIDSNAEFPEHWILRILRRSLGDVPAERAGQGLRRLLRRTS